MAVSVIDSRDCRLEEEGKKLMRITKVYTKTGDKGKTRLAGGQQVWKDSLRVDAYGAVDELNAVIGMARAWNKETRIRNGPRVTARLDRELHWVQNKLFDLGGLLATAPGQTFKNMPCVSAGDVTRLEQFMDVCQKELLPLKEFVLPGGGKVASLLHHARTVCRRAERDCVRLARKESVDEMLVIYLNRLSDTLFVAARWILKKEGQAEILWQREPA
jgi:cob(I)alamin adenosyltransferase